MSRATLLKAVLLALVSVLPVPCLAEAADTAHPLAAMPLRVAESQFPGLLADLGSIASDLAALEVELEGAGAPWTPARIPQWPTGAR